MLKKYRVTSEAFIDNRLVHAGEVVEMEEAAAKDAAHLQPVEEGGDKTKDARVTAKSGPMAPKPLDSPMPPVTPAPGSVEASMKPKPAPKPDTFKPKP